MSGDIVLATALAYVGVLFLVASVSDRRARHGRLGLLRSPLVYTLSISIYCTTWTFYGAVGSAARNGLEFATIYLGPTLVFVGWWVLLRKLVRIGHAQGITSIADLISSRYGKSAPLAALVTLISVIGTAPYIALQLKAVTASFDAIDGIGPDPLSGMPGAVPDYTTAFWITVGLALFAILFGTRNLDAKERHHGVIAAIALEAVVKLVALVAVGLLVVYGIADGPADIFARASPGFLHTPEVFGSRWIAMTFLAATAVVCLPREFHVTVVENLNEQHLRTASWLFPLYLFLITLFVLPIAIAGLHFLPEGANPDMFVLTLPMFARQDAITLLAFLGGFSAATLMVIVSSIAVSTMISNHLIMPIALRLRRVSSLESGEIGRFLLASRRLSICAILLLGFLYFRASDNPEQLAAIGLVSFVGVAQVLPCLLGALFWRGANAGGAMAGLVVGALIWLYTLLLPSFGGHFAIPQDVIADGLFGRQWLRPQALFGMEGVDPLVHSVFWSMSLNTLAFVLMSLRRDPRPLERLQGALFVDVYRTPSEATSRVIQRSATVNDLSILAQRILGGNEALEIFRQAAREQGLGGSVPVPDNAFITQLERKLAGSVGAASAHAMISQIVTGETISLDKLIEMADEAQRVREYSRRLEEKSNQLEAAAEQLRAANERLTRLDAEKDDFLSQVSHEVRTPMTSIRSFAEILIETRDLDAGRRQHFLEVIHEESVRLTRLLDRTLELTLLERGEMPWEMSAIDPERVLQSVIATCEGLAAGMHVQLLNGERAAHARVEANSDRLAQVFINVISNAIKYNTSDDPCVRITSRLHDGRYEVLVEDNGPGIAPDEREKIFSKFMRGDVQARSDARGAGLGLAISREIMRRFGGTLTLVEGGDCGACFRIALACA